MIAEVFTDGSCNPQTKTGAWASIIFNAGKKEILSGIVEDTTHNRMELLAVIKAVGHIQQNHPAITQIQIVSDSQYVIGIERRQAKFEASNFKTKAGDDIRNVDLVKELIALSKSSSLTFVKIKAHQKPTDVENYNIEVDKLCRKLMREHSAENSEGTIL
ncbi:MAG: hypothetical protein K0S33_2550 [Bacteroidetes bacterium]|jgi:ribonuclease HI|nr:hypothetical protein [Bacteroidota bacterium]